MAKLTRGQRFFLVRLAAGDGVKKPEPIRSFIARVERETGFVIHASELSEIENDSPSKAVTAEHIEAVAAVDPKRRGKLWLGWEEEQAEPVFHVPIDIIKPLDEQEGLRRAANKKAAPAKGGHHRGKRAG